MSTDSEIERPRKRSTLLFALPLIIFAALCILFIMQLFSGRQNSTVPSALIGQPVPTFELAALEGSGLPGFSTKTAAEADLTLINVWASWCVPCRSEHPYVTTLAADERLKVFGLNYKDTTEDAISFLDQLGNPYDAIGADINGRIGIEFGVYGVPETFVIDKTGTIVHKFIGPITQRRLENELMPAIEKALNNQP